MRDERVPVHTSAFHSTRPSLAQGINGWCIHVDPTTRGVLVAVNNDHLSPVSTILWHNTLVPVERAGIGRLLLGPYRDVLDDRVEDAIDEKTAYILRAEGLAPTIREAATLAAAGEAVDRALRGADREDVSNG